MILTVVYAVALFSIFHPSILQRRLGVYYILGFTPEVLRSLYKSLSISCLAYTNYLLQISAIQPIELAVSAVLPCYWIYHEVGKYIVQHTNLSNPFTKWISTYSREKFNQNLLEITKIFNELALNSTKETQQKMCNEFYKSSVLEWHFWNDAYNMKNYDNLNLCD